MRTARLALLSTAVVAPLVGAAILLPAAADVTQPRPVVEELTTLRGTFTDDVSLKFKIKVPHAGTQVVSLDGASEVAVARITVQPGGAFPLHTHPGPVVVSVIQGELTYVDADTCAERVYPAGEAFVDAGSDVHTAYGSSSGVTTLIATFFGAPTTGPLTIPEPVQISTCA